MRSRSQDIKFCTVYNCKSRNICFFIWITFIRILTLSKIFILWQVYFSNNEIKNKTNLFQRSQVNEIFPSQNLGFYRILWIVSSWICALVHRDYQFAVELNEKVGLRDGRMDGWLKTSMFIYSRLAYFTLFTKDLYILITIQKRNLLTNALYSK